MEAVNRKLIRPSLNEIKEQIAPPAARAAQKSRRLRTKRTRRISIRKANAGEDPHGVRPSGWRNAPRDHRVVRQVLPEGKPVGRSESAALQAGHQVHVQGVTRAFTAEAPRRREKQGNDPPWTIPLPRAQVRARSKQRTQRSIRFRTLRLCSLAVNDAACQRAPYGVSRRRIARRASLRSPASRYRLFSVSVRG